MVKSFNRSGYVDKRNGVQSNVMKIKGRMSQSPISESESEVEEEVENSGDYKFTCLKVDDKNKKSEEKKLATIINHHHHWQGRIDI